MNKPEKSSVPALMEDPPRWVRWLVRYISKSLTDNEIIAKRRAKIERKRQRSGSPHRVEYFHQLDDPYSHLTAQILATFASRYNIELVPHLIHATGGDKQPALEKLERWARKDCGWIAPHYKLSFPQDAGVKPDEHHLRMAGRILAGLSAPQFLAQIDTVSRAMWEGNEEKLQELLVEGVSEEAFHNAMEQGSSRLAKLKHYSGATFYYGGEWYWGVDRLFHLEQRLRDLGACHEPDTEVLVQRPAIDVQGVDASGLRLDFYPSLNSPYTAIIYDRVIALKEECGIEFHHKPVFPMLMRGLPVPPPKAKYILFDTKREANTAGLPFGPMVTPVGSPVKQAYSMMPWAKSIGKDEALLSSLLRHAFCLDVGLHTEKGMRRAVEAAGLDWNQAKEAMKNDEWLPVVQQSHDEMIEGLGLWGVPSFHLSGPDGEPDLAVWGQDRLWLVAAEIRRRAAL